MADPVSFRGGMNVPGPIGRANATFPFAELVMTGPSITLRPRWLGHGMLSAVRTSAADIEAAYRVRRLPLRAGIGIRLRNGTVVFFWTWREARVLAALAAHGVHVEPGSHRARGVYRIRSSPEAMAVLPATSVLLRALTPALVLPGTALAVVLVLVNPSWHTSAFAIAGWTTLVSGVAFVWGRGQRR
ncbi:MAG: hypothetical protein ACJ72O_10985 [Marmoricola sp.]